MACNCKAGKKAEKIREMVSGEVEEENGGRIKDAFMTGVDYTFSVIKMILVCIAVLVVTPFISLFVIFSIIKSGNVTISVPEFLKELKKEENG